jgi:hypothetical protein
MVACALRARYFRGAKGDSEATLGESRLALDGLSGKYIVIYSDASAKSIVKNIGIESIDIWHRGHSTMPGRHGSCRPILATALLRAVCLGDSLRRWRRGHRRWRRGHCTFGDAGDSALRRRGRLQRWGYGTGDTDTNAGDTALWCGAGHYRTGDTALCRSDMVAAGR